jgi:hypothetical protein
VAGGDEVREVEASVPEIQRMLGFLDVDERVAAFAGHAEVRGIRVALPERQKREGANADARDTTPQAMRISGVHAKSVRNQRSIRRLRGSVTWEGRLEGSRLGRGTK